MSKLPYDCPGYTSGKWHIYRGRAKEPVFSIEATFSLANEVFVKRFVNMLNTSEVPGAKNVI